MPWKLLREFILVCIVTFLSACAGGAGETTDTSPPSLTDKTPASGSEGVSVDSVITAKFSERLDQSTINSSTFFLKPDISGSVTYDVGANTATFTPDEKLLYSTTYTATIASAVADLSGNALGENQSWSFSTIVDSTPPSTSINSDGGIFNSIQSVTLTCSDTESGCEGTYYTTDGSDPTTGSPMYTEAIDIETNTKFQFFSIDRVGNAEPVTTIDFTIDMLPPVTTASQISGYYNKSQEVTYYNERQYVTLDCDGTGTDCEKIYFTTDGTDPTINSSVYDNDNPISMPLSDTRDPDTILKYFAIDQAGNNESIQTKKYFFDTTPPATTASLSGDKPYNTEQGVTLDCTDTESGCGVTYYSIDDANPTKVYENETQIPITQSSTLYFYSEDNVSNKEENVQHIDYVIDKQSPLVESTDPETGSIINTSRTITVNFNEQMDISTLDLSGSLADESDFEWVENDKKLYIRPSTEWSDGEKDITINAADVAGNYLASPYQLNYTVDGDKPGVSKTNPVQTSILSNTQSIEITFSEPMDVDSGTFGGTLLENGFTSFWDDNVTLTINPLEAWEVGTDKTIDLKAVQDLAGNEIEVTLNYDVATLHVSINSEAASDDTTDPMRGKKDLPFQTIQAAMNYAQDREFGPAEIRVAEGTYEINSQTENPIELVEGISLLGGYDVDENGTVDWTKRIPKDNPVIIQDTSTSGGTSDDPVRAVDAGTGITTATIFDGFTVIGGTGSDGSVVAALYNHDGASPTIRECVLQGGEGSFGVTRYGLLNVSQASPVIENCKIYGGSDYLSDSSYAIYNDSSSPTIRNSEVDGGAAEFLTVGIRNRDSSSAVVEGNMIKGGTGEVSYGISNINSSPQIINNKISSGLGDDSYGIVNFSNSTAITPLIEGNTIRGSGFVTSVGIDNRDLSNSIIRNNVIDGGTVYYTTAVSISQSSPTLQNNTIYLGESDDSVGVSLSTNTTGAILQNNIIYGKYHYDYNSYSRYCIEETDATSPTLTNNNLYGCRTALYRDYSAENTVNYNNISQVNDLVGAGSGSLNVSTDPVVVDSEKRDWHLTSLTPEDVSIGGENLYGVFSTDKDGEERSSLNPWSIGAYIAPTTLINPNFVIVDFFKSDADGAETLDMYTEDGFQLITYLEEKQSQIVIIRDNGESFASNVNLGDNKYVILKRANGKLFDLTGIRLYFGTTQDTFTVTGLNENDQEQTITLPPYQVPAGYQFFSISDFTDLKQIKFEGTEFMLIDDIELRINNQ